MLLLLSLLLLLSVLQLLLMRVPQLPPVQVMLYMCQGQAHQVLGSNCCLPAPHPLGLLLGQTPQSPAPHMS
jgi:hypothetical protein